MKTNRLHVVFMSVSICLITSGFFNSLSGQTTYTWIGANDGSWAVATNWSPDRTTPATNDILQFNGGTSLTITSVGGTSNQTIGNLIVTNNSVITLTSTIGRTITVGNITGTDLTIDSGSHLLLGASVNVTMAANSTASIDGTLTIGVSRTYTSTGTNVLTTISGTIINYNTFASATTKAIFQNGSTYEHARNGGSVDNATWAANSTCLITGVTTTIPSFANETYGNIIWNCSGQTTTENFPNNSCDIIQGDLTIQSTGSGMVTNTATLIQVGGNFYQSGGSFRLAAGTPFTLTITGNFNFSGGTLDMCSGTAATDLGTINLAGNFVHNSGTLTVSSTGSGRGEVYFNGNSPQYFTSGGTVSGRINYTVNNLAILMMSTGLLGDGSTGTFTLLGGSTLGIGDAQGITASGASGNIRVTGTRTYNTTANYIFNGTGTQVSGNGLPLTVNSLTLSGTSDFTITNSPTFAVPFIVTAGCTINSGAKLTLGATQAMTVGGSFTNDSGNSGFLIKSDATGTGSLKETSGINASAELYLTQNKWHYISAPVNDPTANVFFGMYMMKWDEPTEAWSYITNPNFIMAEDLQGYAIWSQEGMTGNSTVTFAGNLNAGARSINVTNTAGGPNVNNGYNFVGNPYPSALNWNVNDGSGWSRTAGNIDLSLYIWNQAFGNYGVYVKDGGMGTNGVDNIIPPHQGYFVHCSAASGSLGVDDGARVHDSKAILKSGQNESGLLKLKVEGNNLSDEMIIQINPLASTAFDQSDALKFFGSEDAPQIYTLSIDNKQISINSFPLAENYKVIPLGLEVGAYGLYTITVSEFITFEPFENIFLEDKKEGTYTKLDANSTVSFSAGPLDDPLRFLLHLNGELDVPDVNTALKDILIYSFDHSVYISSEDNLTGWVTIYDLLGQKIINERLTGEMLRKINLGNHSGYLIVQILTDKGSLSKKVYLK